MKNRPAGLAFILFTIVIDSMGIGLVAPVLPRLIETYVGGSTDDASRWYGYLMALYGLMVFLFSPTLGVLSDRFGRRPVLLLSLLGQSADYMLLAFAPHLWLFVVGRMVAGMAGASITTAQAYIADISSAENRAKNYGMVFAAFGVGFIIGPAIGGWVAQWGLRAPFYVAAGLAFLNAMYGWFVLPESLGRENRTPNIRLRRANPFGVFAGLLSRKALVWLVATYALMALAGQVWPSIWVIFTDYQLGWDEGQTGLSLAFVGLMIGLVQGVLTGRVVKAFGERRTLRYGLALCIVGLFMVGTVNEGWMAFAFFIPYSIGGVGSPALQALVTTRVGPREQGQLQGALMGLMSLASVAAPLIYTNLFAATTGEGVVEFAGSPFWMAAAFMLLAFVLASFAVRRLPARLQASPHAPEPENPAPAPIA